MKGDFDQGLGPRRVQRSHYHLLSYLAENYLATGRWDKAEEYVQRAAAAAQGLEDQEVKITQQLSQAALVLAKGEYDNTHQILESAIHAAQASNLPDLEWRGRYLLGRLAEKIGDFSASRAAYRQAIHLVESLKQYVPQTELQTSFLAKRYDPYKALVSLETTKFNNDAGAFVYLDSFKARLLLSKLTGRPAALTQERLADGKEWVNSIRQALPRDLVIVEYFIGKDSSRAFILDAQSFHSLPLPVTHDQVSSQVSGFLDRLRQGRVEEKLGAGKALYRSLVAPIKAFIRPQSTLCIIPDDPLFHIPFSALISEANRFLIDEYALSRVPSAAILQWHLRQSQGRADGKARKVLVIAADEQLQEAKQEAHTVYESYRPNSVYLANPKERELAELIPRFEILHFAGHADRWGDGSAALRLAASLSAEDNEKGRKQSTRLHRGNIRHWPLTDTRLVNLSACGTALGKYWASEGSVGLPSAFLAAGASAVLASFWEVDSEATRQLMERFYAHLQKDGTSKAEALRQAQSEMIKSGPPFQDPFYWASFALVGDPR